MPGQNTVALHETIRNEITRRVDVGDYEVGVPLPSAASLADDFGVSVITIKRAIRDLQTAGTLRSVPGLGTFVREKHRFVRDLDFSLTSLDDARRLGLQPSLKLISITRERIRDSSTGFFAMSDAPLICVRKMILVDQLPIMHDTTFLPVSIEDEVIEELGDKLILEALREHGTSFTDTKLMIDAAPASDEAQVAFGLPSGYPTLRRFYRLNTTNPSFSVFGVAESPFDRLACTIELESDDSNVRRRVKRPTDGAKASKDQQ